MKHLNLLLMALLLAVSGMVMADDMKKDAMDDGMMKDSTMHGEDAMDASGKMMEEDGMMKKDDHQDMSSETMKDSAMDDDMKKDTMMDQSGSMK